MIAASHSTVPSNVRLEPYPASPQFNGHSTVDNPILLACIESGIVLKNNGGRFDHRDGRRCICASTERDSLSTNTCSERGRPDLLVSKPIHRMGTFWYLLSQHLLHLLLHAWAVYACASMHGDVRIQVPRRYPARGRLDVLVGLHPSDNLAWFLGVPSDDCRSCSIEEVQVSMS